MPDLKINRRDFLRASAALAPAYALGARTVAGQGAAQTGTAPAGGASTQPQGGTYAYVGTYTPNGGGIYLFRVDAVSGALTQLQVFDDIRNPSWLALNPAQNRLYAISEIDNFRETRGGAVVAYAVDPATMQIKRLNAVSSGGANPSYISVHPSGKFAFVANYGGGNVAVFPIASDGSLGEASDIRPGVGARHRARAVDDPPGQFAISDHDSPHPHMVACDASGQFVIANDAGLDLTLVWRLDAQAGRLLPADAPVVAAPSGSAPRHFVFHPNGRIFYNLYEHDAKIAVYDYEAARGAMKFKQSITTLPPKFAGSNLSSEIIMTADGRFLYTSNRLHNSIAVFAVAADGQLRSVAENWVHADSPRNISIDPSGEFLYSCNQKGDSITSFRISPVSGTLSFTGRFEPVGSPASLVFLKPV